MSQYDDTYLHPEDLEKWAETLQKLAQRMEVEGDDNMAQMYWYASCLMLEETERLLAEEKKLAKNKDYVQ